MVIGIMGGTFDPVHKSHLLLATTAQSALSLDRVLWIPTGLPPHKKTSATNQDRIAMLRLAIKDLSGHEIDLCEIERDGYSRTVDTLLDLHTRYPDAEFVFIIGGDTVMQLRSWKDIKTVCSLCSFAVGIRPSVLYEQMQQELLKLEQTFRLRYTLLPFSCTDTSSTNIRNMIGASGEDLSERLPPAVYEYIKAHNLYKELV